MIDELYDRFSEIESASAEIEKIINVYLKFAYSKEESKDEIVYSNLAVNTFNYMIETDDTLKVLTDLWRNWCRPVTRTWGRGRVSTAKSWTI
jgi:type I restriction-modification system DNA methylase subunit